jgi:predicted enzyme related to lactoylglutathione lyase
MAVVADPEGATFCLWEPREFGGAGLVNAPGSWNWSDLHARDVDAAEAFYGAVFGWVTQRVDFGGAEARMWRLEGYGDVLARRDPGIRERHAETGVPPGFTDAVGWLQTAADGVAPHWSVTFAVDDADGAARRAAELGGTVTVAPFDAGPARVAVLADPEGAPFVVSHYDPARAT